MKKDQKIVNSGGSEFLELITKAVGSATNRHSTEIFASKLEPGNGVSGYIYDTVPVALHAWFRSPQDYRSAVIESIRCAGDTDTAASIVGGIVGASCLIFLY